MVVLKVKDIASRDTKGRVYTDDLEKTLGFTFLHISSNVLMSIRVDLAGSKIAITSEKIARF